MKKKFWTSDRIVSFSAIFISSLTLIIFIRQTNIIDRQSRLSAIPYLMMDSSNNSETQTFAIDIVNYGVGPAFIEYTSFFYKGKQYNMQFNAFLRENLTEMDSVKAINISTLQKGQAIPAGDKVNIITVGGGETSYRTFLKIIQMLEAQDFNYQIQYKSIYGERWMIDGKNSVPEEL